MIKKLDYIYILLLIIITPTYTLYSLFGYFPFFPLSLFVIAFGFSIFSIRFFLSLFSRDTFLSGADFITAVAFIWFFCCIIYNYNYSSATEDGRNINAFRYYMPFFVLSLLTFVSFRNAHTFFESKLAKLSIATNIVILLIICIRYTDFSAYKMDYSSLYESGFIGIYQVVSDALCFTVICYLCMTKIKVFNSILIIILTLACLFVLNSRSALFSFLLALVFLFPLKKYVIKHPLQLILSIIAIMLIPFFIYGEVISFVNNIHEYNDRIFNIFSGNFENDPSFLGRLKLLENSINIISSNPILGDFGSQHDRDIDGFGIRWGAYTHNVLVYWDQFGLIGFILIMIMMIIIINGGCKIRKKNDVNLFPLIILVIIQQIFMKSFTYFYFFALLGLIVGISNAHKRNSNNM